MNKFYVIANSQKDMDFAMADKISEYIIAKGGTCVCQKRDIGKEGIKYNSADASLIPEGTECVIVLGGDGTLIQAARDLSSINVPVFGINIGTLFSTAIFFLVFVGALTLLFGWAEKKLDYFR